MQDLTESFVELVRRASTSLPADVEAALQAAQAREEPGSAAAGALGTILENVALARANSTPVCQDTGTPIFYVHHPLGTSTRELRAQAEAAVAEEPIVEAAPSPEAAKELTVEAEVEVAAPPVAAEELAEAVPQVEPAEAVAEAEEINAACAARPEDDYVKFSGGVYSSEWFWSKILHTIRHNKKIHGQAFSWVEHCDWISGLLCGETDPLTLKRILGRSQQMLTLPDGQKLWTIFSESKMVDLMEMAPIRQFQFVQKTLETMEVRLAVARALDEAEEAAVKAWVAETFHHPFAVDFKYFDEIPRTREGKYFDFMSEVEG